MERLGIIMKFLDAEFVQGFIRMADDGWQQGWHERNGGNLSYRVKPEEVELVNPKIVATGKNINGFGYTDYQLIADDIKKKGQK